MIGTQRAGGTERLDERSELGAHELVRLLAERVVDPRPIPAAFDDAGVLQDRELSRCVGLAEIQRLLEVTYAQLTVREQGDDADPRLVTEGAKHLRQGANVESGCAGQHETCISRCSHVFDSRAASTSLMCMIAPSLSATGGTDE
jgi:hypothetical protein